MSLFFAVAALFAQEAPDQLSQPPPSQEEEGAQEKFLLEALMEGSQLFGNINVAFESQYVFRGSVQADESLQTSINLYTPVDEGELMFGVWNNNDLMSAGTAGGDINDDEVDIYLNYTYPLNETLSVQVGYIHYWWPDAATGRVTSTAEMHLGLIREYYALWGATVYYDWDLDRKVYELTSGYSYSLEQMKLPKTSIDLVAYLGHVRTGSPKTNRYTYGGINADVVHRLNDTTRLSFGPRLAFNNDDNGPANGVAGAFENEDALWWGTALCVDF